MNRKRVCALLLTFVFVFSAMGSFNIFAAGDADYQVDVVIIGAGGAGMSAALEANTLGALNIVVLESMSHVGGTTLTALAGISATGTRYHPPNSGTVADMADHALSIGGINDIDLITTLSERSAEGLHWLNDYVGAGLTNLSDWFQLDGHMRMFNYGPSQPPGALMAMALERTLLAKNIPLLLNTRAVEILVDDDGAVSGVVAVRDGTEITFATTAVIIATGGFGADMERVGRHNADFAGKKTSAHAGNLGDGHDMAVAIGADTLNMEFIAHGHMLGPTLNAISPPPLRANGAIIVNEDGVRVANESGTNLQITTAMRDTSMVGGFRASGHLIFDERIRATVTEDADGLIALGRIEDINVYIARELVAVADTIAELAGLIGVDAAALEATVSQYNDMVAAGVDTAFDRTAASLGTIEQGPFYASPIFTAVYGSIGGLRINTDAQVLRADGSPIVGLFAAGEVTGGVFGGQHGFGRPSGYSLMDLVVFGRIAGENAVALASDNGGLTPRTVIITPEAPPTPQVQGNFANGIFVGSSFGYGGPLNVRVTIAANNIVGVELFDHYETPVFYHAAERTIASHLIRYQDIRGVDIASGATLTSFAMIMAVNNALEGAALD